MWFIFGINVMYSPMTIQKCTLRNLDENQKGYGIKYFQSPGEQAAYTSGEKESHALEGRAPENRQTYELGQLIAVHTVLLKMHFRERHQ